jgi:diphthamide synthase (EF-2-diphthine--ammonia ligase)
VGARYALLWSGGKDSALALDRAAKSGIEVGSLLNFYDAAAGRVRFHATRVEMIQAQADAIGIELRAIGTTWAEMEGRLLEELGRLRREGFAGVVLGDIHLVDVRAWYEGRVTAAGLSTSSRSGADSRWNWSASSWRPAAAPSSLAWI